jgi:hypothetical protein
MQANSTLHIYFPAPTKKLNLETHTSTMHTEEQNNSQQESRRNFIKKSTALAALAAASPIIVKAAENDEKIAYPLNHALPFLIC